MPPRQTLTRFARVLLTMGSGESPWLIVAFVLGVVAIGIASNFVFSVVAFPATISLGSGVRVVLCVAVLVLCAYAAYRYDLKVAWDRARLTPTIKENAAPISPGMIWLLSLGRPDLPCFAIRYHYATESAARLRHCWVLITPDVKAANAFDLLKTRIDELGYDVQLHPVELASDTANVTYQAIESIYTDLARKPEIDLAPRDIVSDMTGGTKQLTAGMVMACLLHEWPLEYIVSERDKATGWFIDGTQQVVLVNVDFALSS